MLCYRIKICLQKKGTPLVRSLGWVTKATAPHPRREGTSTPLLPSSAAPSSSLPPARYFPQCCSRSPSPTARSARTRRTRLTASLARGRGRRAGRFVWWRARQRARRSACGRWAPWVGRRHQRMRKKRLSSTARAAGARSGVLVGEDVDARS
jgi:hypothetical protein